MRCPITSLNKVPALAAAEPVSLGLDLQGGSYLLLEVELDQVQKDKLESLMSDIRVGLRKAHIALHRSAAERRHGLGAHARCRSAMMTPRRSLTDLNPVLTGIAAVGGSTQ